jgi:hypothetical protein
MRIPPAIAKREPLSLGIDSLIMMEVVLDVQDALDLVVGRRSAGNANDWRFHRFFANALRPSATGGLKHAN